MLFKKEFLQELKESENYISEKIVDHGRWTITYRRIFEYEGKTYETFYSVGATEYQDERPYEYDEDMIECREVHPIEKTIIIYE